MELTIEGHPSFHVEGTVTVELPSYMRLLPPEELEEARTADNRDGLILAAGRHPKGDIVFLTGAGELLEIKHGQHQIPDGPVKPIDYGQTIHIDDGRKGYELSNLWSIDNATMIIFLGAMVEPGGTRISYEDS